MDHGCSQRFLLYMFGLYQGAFVLVKEIFSAAAYNDIQNKDQRWFVLFGLEELDRPTQDHDLNPSNFERKWNAKCEPAVLANMIARHHQSSWGTVHHCAAAKLCMLIYAYQTPPSSSPVAQN